MAADILILFLIAAYCIFLIYRARKNAKEGKSSGCAGCGGSCGSCADVRQMWERQKRKLTRASYGNKQCEIVKKDMYKEDM